MKTVRFAQSSRELPVGKILCIGRNYAAHAKEMAADVPAEPVVFLKPSTALVANGGTVVFPPFSHDLHHEVEMVVVIGAAVRSVPESAALDAVAGYAVGLDMTLRDVQAVAKKQGLPWAVAKGFDTSAPLSLAVERSVVPDPGALTLSLRVNGQVRQHASTADMIFSVPRLVSFLSGIFTLEPGDLIFTGSPEGVAGVRPGDVLEADLERVGRLRVSVVAGEPVHG
jgi:2-keto-4-pentenoate hydratase/2-oxohepta-3-ene-1,7-dioic acid hydratase in catechol pathway